MTKPEIKIKNEAGVCHIEIEGTIGVPEEWQFEEPDSRVATYERFREAVARIAAVEASEVIVTIRSTGGDVNDALLIHDALRQLPGRVTTRCFGYTASAATIIAQAASEGCRLLSPNTLYLIHRATCSTEGNAEGLEAQAALLRTTDERLSALYATRSGLPKEQFEALMAENGGSGRWLSPQEAIEAGLADSLIGSVAEQSSTLVENIAAGLKRLARAVGIHEEESLPEPRNVFHFDAAGSVQQRRKAIDEAQKAVAASQLNPTDDPPFSERVISANERAYARDIKAFRNY